jgi:ATP-dependent Lon protease
MINEELPDSLPIFTVAEHGTISWCCNSITAGRDKSIKLINDANAAGKNHRVVAQKMSQMKTHKTIHTIGTVAKFCAF